MEIKLGKTKCPVVLGIQNNGAKTHDIDADVFKVSNNDYKLVCPEHLLVFRSNFLSTLEIK